MIIGVTGIFGSGKTTVAKMLAKKLHYRLMDADRIAWQAFRKNRARIKRIFGTADKKKLGKIAFGDKKKLKQLQGIIHPYVLGVMKKEAGKRDAVMDVPLLIEAGAHRFVDIVIVVKCAERVRIKRLAKKGFTLPEIRKRTRHQMSISKKIKYADYVIDNSKTLSMTEEQVDKVLKRVRISY